MIRTPLQLRHMPLPSNDAELAIVSEWYFGMPLHLSKLSAYGDYASYEVMELYDAYHGDGWNFSKGCTRGYDYSRAFWGRVVGDLYCGGIAAHSYGQVKVAGWRHKKRLQRWIKDRLGKGVSAPRNQFIRLAQQNGLRENIAIRGSGVLTDDRADGASGASLLTA